MQDLSKKLTFKQHIAYWLLGLALALLGGGAVKLGEVATSTQTSATTTPQVATFTSLCSTTGPVPGVLDSVNFLNMGTGSLLLMDATTTDITKRTGNYATTSLILAWFPPGFGTSTNHFGIEFKTGLTVVYTSAVATTSISYRCGP